MKNNFLLIVGLVLFPFSLSAQTFQDGYVTWGFDSQAFPTTVSSWASTYSVNEDDNFFISRIKPKERFRNTATQVRQDLTEENDKKLIAWVPINTGNGNALPDGKFDSEVFSMWSYVTHWGDWNAPLGRVPAAFLDAAHKNGVAVSSVASVPYGYITSAWSSTISALSQSDAETTAKFMRYYGVDGLGYNSEFSGVSRSTLEKLRTFHENLVKNARTTNPLFENIWYDGTNDNGVITFDRGLASHNKETFGDGDHIRTSLFLNYNWNSSSLLSQSVTQAANLNRSSLDLYAGVNMQGGEPSSNNWPLLKDYAISIGLWGAHSENMWWESRGEKGSNPATQQRTYMLRTERWFTGGTRNPANCPDVTSSMKYIADNYTFHGMSSFMTARSSLKWNLSDEPFITYFNLGNGQYFNWQGVRQTDKEWYNIGVQDYLPTWRWWLASSLLGRNASDVPSTGLDAEFTWDDAYVGGSSMRIYGTTTDEYLHLFKTEYALQEGDVITVRYKVKKGTADLNLILTATGAEGTAINENDFALLTTSQETDEDEWVERSYQVTGALAGKNLALVALHFRNATDLDMYVGEFSIIRGISTTPNKPEITKASILAYNKEGVDAKLIFNMANNKAVGEPCYNIDVNASLFKLYSQQQGEEAKLVGITTSWAALFYSAPMNVSNTNNNIRLGVSALSLDMKSESEIAWSDYLNAGTYVYSDDIQIDKTMIKPNEDFTLSFVDVKHEDATWSLYDNSGNKVFEASGNSVTCSEGLPNVGSYTLKLTGPVYADDGTTRTTTTREYGSYVQITSESVGALPKILTLTANDKEADIEVKANENISLAYTGRQADGSGSQGVDLAEQRFGAKCADLGLVGKQSFSVACWLKINKLAEGDTQLLAVANKLDNWPKTDWGWIWTNIDDTGGISSFTFRGTDATSNKELQYNYDTKIPIGTWAHLAFVFDWNSEGNLHCDFYLNGVKQEIKGWTRTGGSMQTTEPGYQEDVYAITDGMVLSMGGNAHGRSGIDGVIDNLIVWNKAITADEVSAAMGDIDPNNLSSDVISFWNLETAASSDYTYASVGSIANVAAGLHSYDATGGEGQGSFNWIASDVTAGCPFVSGTAFPVTTLPTWKAKKGTLTEEMGSDKAGTAKLTYSKSGDYTVTLTLTNSLGSDSRTFQVIKVSGGASAIDEAQNGNTDAYIVDDKAYVDFAEVGNYVVRIFNTAGQLVANKSQAVSKGQKMQITLNQSGTYILTVQKDGKNVRTVKLLRR